MLRAIFGTETKAKILLFLYSSRESYPTEIASTLGLYLNTVQNQLLNMEKDGLLYSRLRGKVRLFGISPRYPFRKELEALLEKALAFISEEEKKIYFRRLRPRRSGKPLSVS
jgi:DNA-binding transcriptional ArsR family regulator